MGTVILNQRFTLKPLLFLSIFSAFIFFCSTAYANQLQVDGSIINQVVPRGESFIHTFTVQNPDGNLPMKMTVEVGEFAQELDGSYYVLPPGSPEAKAPSAVSFISEINLKSFELAPGPDGAQDIQVDFTIPPNTRPGAYYALINVQSDPASGDQVGIVLAVNIPVVISVPALQRVETGAIKDLYNEELISGEPVIIKTLFQNMGNHHYKVKNRVVVEDSTGREVAKGDSNITSSSVVPGYTYKFKLALEVPGAIDAGNYYILSEVFGEDGSLKDSLRVPFTVSETYYPESPGVEPFSLLLIIALIILFTIIIGLKFCKHILNKRRNEELLEGDFSD